MILFVMLSQIAYIQTIFYMNEIIVQIIFLSMNKIDDKINQCMREFKSTRTQQNTTLFFF